MKKVLTVIILILFACPVFAQDKLSFVYINGSNNNDSKMKNWYIKGVTKLHKTLRKKYYPTYI